MTIIFYLYNFLFTAIFAFYTKYQFEDEKAGFAHSKSEWHKYGLAMRLMLAGAFVASQFVAFTWKDMLLAGAIDMPLWDILINVVALNVAWNYRGSTSTTDKLITGVKWLAYAGFLIGAIVLKFTY
jgi:hypothetical protein